jgi:hypothetical protein
MHHEELEMIRITTGSLLLLMLSTGCARGKLVGTLPPIENDNYAVVHIVRPAKLSGCLGRITIQFNYRDLYQLACGEHLVFRVPAEKAVTISETTSVVPDHYELYPQISKHYYLEHDCNEWACRLHQTNNKSFRNLAHECRHIDLSSWRE